ncbi:MAG: hypothetical protein GC154_16925 [bacterium]|nr:hypothetical protein [bacterium]
MVGARFMQTMKITTAFVLSCLIISGFALCGAADDSSGPVKAALRTSLNAMASLRHNGGWAAAWPEGGEATFDHTGIQTPETIVVRYPATPWIGMAFLRAYGLLGDDFDLNVARQAGDALIQGQLEYGGFPLEITPGLSKSAPCVFEDGATPGAARFLVELWIRTGEEKYAAAAKRCARFILRAQVEHGGFPSRFPLQNDDPARISLQGGATTDAIRFLLLCHKTFGNREYFEAAVRGLDCLLALRGEPPQAGWAQHYTDDGRPIDAGPNHPAALSTVESIDVMRLFMEFTLETGDKSYLRSFPATVAWLSRSRLEDGTWAAFYTFGSNQSVEWDEDGTVVKNRYTAFTDWIKPSPFFNEDVKTFFWVLHDASPDLIRDEYKKFLRGTTRPLLEKSVPTILASLNQDGFWTAPMPPAYRKAYVERFGSNGAMRTIYSLDFIINVNALLDSLEIQ